MKNTVKSNYNQLLEWLKIKNIYPKPTTTPTNRQRR